MHTLISGWTFSTREFGQPLPLLYVLLFPLTRLLPWKALYISTYSNSGTEALITAASHGANIPTLTRSEDRPRFWRLEESERTVKYVLSNLT